MPKFSEASKVAIIQTSFVRYITAHDNTESYTQAVRDRDHPQQVVRELPSDTTMFTYFDIVEATFLINGEQVRTKSGPSLFSGRYFIGGQVLNRDEVMLLVNNGSQVASLAAKQGITKLVRAPKSDIIYPLMRKDVIIDFPPARS